jgi:hypothetical protein
MRVALCCLLAVSRLVGGVRSSSTLDAAAVGEPAVVPTAVQLDGRLYVSAPDSLACCATPPHTHSPPAAATACHQNLGGAQVVWQLPASGTRVKGLLLAFHGCSHSSTDFWPRGPSCDACIGAGQLAGCSWVSLSCWVVEWSPPPPPPPVSDLECARLVPSLAQACLKRCSPPQLHSHEAGA